MGKYLPEFLKYLLCSVSFLHSILFLKMTKLTAGLDRGEKAQSQVSLLPQHHRQRHGFINTQHRKAADKPRSDT